MHIYTHYSIEIDHNDNCHTGFFSSAKTIAEKLLQNRHEMYIKNAGILFILPYQFGFQLDMIYLELIVSPGRFSPVLS